MARLAEAVSSDLRTVARKADARAWRLARSNHPRGIRLALQLRRLGRRTRSIARLVESGRLEPFEGRHQVQDLFLSFELRNFGTVDSIPVPRDQFRFGTEAPESSR